MDENKMQTGDVSLVNKDSRLYRFLDNFWYHYKWPTVIVFVLVLFLTVSVVQCAKKQKYDLYVLYAGGHEVSSVTENTVMSERESIMTSLSSYAVDRDGNGQKDVAFEALYVLTMDEASKTEDVNVSRLSEDTDTLYSEMLYSNYYVCFLSENVYKSYQNQSLFVKLAEYTDNTSLEYVDEYAVKLSSLSIASKPGFDALPEDTVLVMRGLSEVAQKTNGKQNAAVYEAAEAALRALLQ